jgi:hypothetical protein
MIEDKTTPAAPTPTPTPTATPEILACITRSQKMDALHQKTKTMLQKAIEREDIKSAAKKTAEQKTEHTTD